ncbi:DUF4424 domain-containing protein [Rhizobium sp. AG855]|uniref:DUF4424 domain-containing protein n=1 Tax=Rhizobium sp. AG855 TaxID=2183898 RepID=UPI000E73C776|nr:DUF4424 domain-containing protein [Rhizobium sp. AG855]RKE85869.1 uncharacterized protein DUF4424 [Rhizobium sp. AG855]
MKARVIAAAWALTLQGLAATGACANDTMAVLGAGGLTFTRTDQITMAREDLYISPERVDVKYTYRNTGDTDVTTIVAFPMPKIGGPVETMAAVPDEQSDNFMGFSVTQDGETIEPRLQQRVLVQGIDFTDEVAAQGVPLQPLSDKTRAAVARLDETVLQDWLVKGLVAAMDYGAEKPEYVPVWQLDSVYWWETTFPAGEEVNVEHSYRPSLGGTTGMAFLYEGKPDNQFEDYKRRYCIDDDFMKTAIRLEKSQDFNTGLYYFEHWLSYILTTGNNWFGPIGDFHLTVDKGNPNHVVSFCGQDIKKTGDTTFEMRAKEFVPERDLDILLLVSSKDWNPGNQP